MRAPVLALFAGLIILGGARVAQALEVEQYQQVLTSSEFTALKEKMLENDFEFRGISDDGVKYRCPCYTFHATFMKYSGETKVIDIGLNGFPPKSLVTIAPNP